MSEASEALQRLAANKDVLTLVGSAIVVLFMLGVGALLGFGKNVRLDQALLTARLEDYEPGARIAEAAIDDKGKAALARLSDGRLLAARVMGDGVTLRTLAPERATLRLTGTKLSVRFADVGFPSLNMVLTEPPAWLTQLGARP